MLDAVHARALAILVICAGVLGLAGGCASKPKVGVAAPPARIGLTHFSGNALSGATTRPVDVSKPQQAVLVSLRVLSLPHVPQNLLNPIGPQVRLIAADRGGAPVLATGRLTQACRWGADADAQNLQEAIASQKFGSSAEMATYTTAIPPGASALLDLADSAPRANPRGIQIYLHQPEPPSPAGQIELTIVLQDLTNLAGSDVASHDSAEPGATEKPPPQVTRELAVLAPIPVAHSTPAALLVPFRFAGTANEAVLVLMDLSPGRDDLATAQALARCADDLKLSAARGPQPSLSQITVAEWPGFQLALAGLTDGGSRRANLAFLTSRTGAVICEDVTLIADAPTLEQLASHVTKRAADPKLPRTAESLGWALDAAALELAAEMQSSNKLPPEMLAVLIRHTGEVGRNSGSIGELLTAAKDRSQFQSRLIAENLVYLEDNSPSARVRAFDWLASQGKAPPGYDPLGPPRQRIAALERAYDALAQTAASSSTGSSTSISIGNGGKP